MERVRVVKRNEEKGLRERVEPAEPMAGPSPMIPTGKTEVRIAMRPEGEEVYFAILQGDTITGYKRHYGSDEYKRALRSPHVLIGLLEVDRLVKGMILEDTLEELKKLRGALEARTKRVKDRGVLDALPYLLPRITLEDLKKTHGIIVTDNPVDYDALVISKDGEAVRPKEDVATKLLEALIRISKLVDDHEDLKNDLSVVLERYHAGSGEDVLKAIVLEAPLSEIPELVRKMKKLGLKAAPKALVATIKDRLKQDIDSLLAALTIYKELSDLRVTRLLERIEQNAAKIILKAPEDKARKAREMLRDIAPEVAKEVAIRLLKERDLSDDFAYELASFAKLSKEDAMEILKAAEGRKRKKAAAKIYLYASPSEEEVKELKRSPDYALEIASLIGKDAVSLYHRLLGTRLADKAAEQMVSLGLIDEDLKSRLLRFSKRNPLRAAEIAKSDKKLFKRLIDSIYENLDSTKFSLILLENLDVLERDRVEERIPKRLESHEPNEKLIDVVTKLNAENSALKLASIRASRERRELVNRIVEGVDKKLAKRIVDAVTTEELLPLLALKPMLAVKRLREGLLSVEKFERIEAQVLEALSFDDIIDLIKRVKFSEEGLKIALEAAVNKADSRERVVRLIEFSASLKKTERIKPRLAQRAKLLKPEPSEKFSQALRLLGEAFGIEYVNEHFDEIVKILKERKDRYVGRLLVLSNPKRFEEIRRDLGDVAEFLTPEVQPLVPNVVKSLALAGTLKPVYPYEVFRYVGRLPEYLKKSLAGEKVKVDAKNLDSIGEFRKLAIAFRQASFVTKSGPIAFAHAIAALRIFAQGDEEMREVFKRVQEILGTPGKLSEVSVKLPPGIFSGKAKKFARDRELQRTILIHVIEAPYLVVTEEGFTSIDHQRKIEAKRQKKKLLLSVKNIE